MKIDDLDKWMETQKFIIILYIGYIATFFVWTLIENIQ